MTKHSHMYVIEDRGYKTPCWVWIRAKMGNGYGVIRRDYRNHPAHRWFYQEKYGEVPKNLEMDHLCRVRECVNPDHLEVVTHAENGRRGENTKLDWDKVRAIRKLAADGELYVDIAYTYKIAPNTVGMIVAGRRWKEDGGS